MPTFKAESGTGSTLATFLIPIPSVDWFAQCVNAALSEMLEPENWIIRGDVTREDAVELSNTMYASIQLTNFNPFPVGMMFPFGGVVAPDGYLSCDGASYAATDYPELFAQIGYYFGGSGADFNVPNLINSVPVGTGDSFSIGNVGGQEVVVLTDAEMPSHSHTDIGHNHTIPTTIALPAQAGVGFAGLTAVPIVPSFTGTSSANLLNTGGGGAHDNMPPYLAALYIIYAGR